MQGLQTHPEITVAPCVKEIGTGAVGILRGGSRARLGVVVKEGFLEEVIAKSSEISTVEWQGKVRKAAAQTKAHTCGTTCMVTSTHKYFNLG